MLPTTAMHTPTWVQLEAEPAAVIRHEGVTLDQLPELFDQGYAEISDAVPLLQHPPFAVYYGHPNAKMTLELGNPVSSALSGPIVGAHVVQPAQTPAGRALGLTHTGPYNTLQSAWQAFMDAEEAQGWERVSLLEVYISEPATTAPDDLRTDLYLIQ